jgi:hypothetical protein
VGKGRGKGKDLRPSKNGAQGDYTPLVIADSLERGEINPRILERIILADCVGIYKAKGYSNVQIAKIIQLHERNIPRYMKLVRLKNRVLASPDLQNETIGDAAHYMDCQSDRLISLSFHEGLNPSEQARLIVAACQVKKYKIDFMSEHGYLNRKFTEESTRHYSQDRVEQMDIERYSEAASKAWWLVSPEKRKELQKFVYALDKELKDRLDAKVKEWLKESPTSD